MKIHFAAFVLISFISTNLFSQQETIKIVKPSESSASAKENPCFSSLNLTYPQLAKDKKISGTVIISCDIDTTCSIVNRKIVTGLGYGCDEAALQALDQMESNNKRCYSSACKPEKNKKISIKFTL